MLWMCWINADVPNDSACTDCANIRYQAILNGVPHCQKSQMTSLIPYICIQAKCLAGKQKT